MISENLFVRLEKQYTTPGIGRTEDFLTELIADLLARDSDARNDFLDAAIGGEAKSFRVCTVGRQVVRHLGTDTLRFDLVLSSGRKELLVENKVDAKLKPSQLKRYLRYVRKRRKAYLLLACRDRNKILEQTPFKDPPKFFKGEILWGEVADCWESKRQTYKCKCLVESVLEFMEHHKMGPVRPFEAGAKLDEAFHEKATAMLTRLQSRLKKPAWVEDGRFQAHGVYPTGDGGGHKNYRSYKGLLWSCPADATPDKSDRWYFVGFRFGPPHKGLVRPLKPGQPECIAYVDVWRPEKLRGFIVEEARRLNTGLSAPFFEVDNAENPKRVLLFRRKPLKDFIKETDQTAAILNFLEESHKKLEPVVPKIHEHYRQGTGPGVSGLPPTQSPILPSS